MTVTDYSDWNTPQAHADDISNTGVPLLTRPDNLVNLSGTVASGATVTIASGVHVSKIGYEISLTWFAGAAAASQITMQLIWIDSVSGQTVITDEWNFLCGSGPLANAHIIRGSGPTKGDTLTVKAIQSASTVTASFTVVMAQNSRVYVKDDWRTTFLGPVTGFTLIQAADPAGMVLGSNNAVAVAAGASVTFVLPLFAGKVHVQGVTTSAAADYGLVIHGVTAIGGGLANDQVARGNTDAKGLLRMPDVYLPRAQCTIQQINNNAAAQSLLSFLTMAEY